MILQILCPKGLCFSAGKVEKFSVLLKDVFLLDYTRIMLSNTIELIRLPKVIQLRNLRKFKTVCSENLKISQSVSKNSIIKLV